MTLRVWTHCVATPSRVSPTLLTSAVEERKRDTSLLNVFTEVLAIKEIIDYHSSVVTYITDTEHSCPDFISQ